MGYIYCITNLENLKKYIGKTIYSITKRFKEHCRDYKKEHNENRPLYKAMLKYGEDKFVVEKLIECDDEELSSYEIFFIEKFDTYHNGYNATRGGDGKILFNYKEIIDTYLTGITIKETAAKLKCSIDTVSNILNLYNIKKHHIRSGCCTDPIKVKQYDLLNNFIKEWNSISDAAHWLVDNGYAKTYNGGVTQKIGLCRKGLQKTAYKFIWK